MKVDDSPKQLCSALWYNIYLFYHYRTYEYISIVIDEVHLYKKSHKLGLYSILRMQNLL